MLASMGRQAALVVVSLLCVATALRTPHPERLSMTPITLETDGGMPSSNGVGSAPERYSGYFDLNRLIGRMGRGPWHG